MLEITIKEIIKILSTSVADDPDTLSRYLIVLTANLWKYGKDRIEKDSKQASVWALIRLETKTDGQADKQIKATPEWRDWQMATISEKTVLELIRSIKKRLQSLNEERKSY